MAKVVKSDDAVKEKFIQKKRNKQIRRQIFRALLAILLVLLLVGSAIAPVFSETVGRPKIIMDGDIQAISVMSRQFATQTTDVVDPTVDVTEDHFQDLMDIIENNYYKDVDKAALIEGAYQGMMNVLDPHSTYFKQQDYDQFIQDLSGELIGIGASISQSDSGYIQVISPIKGSPAEKAGLLAGDLILSVNGVDAEHWSVEKAISLIRGEKGTSVSLKVKRKDTETLSFNIVRDVIIIKTVNYKILGTGEGYIEITQFGEKTSSEFEEAINYMTKNKVTKLIVDVRNNPGGYLDTAIDLSDYFVDQGKMIVKESFNDGKTKSYRAARPKLPMKIAVLVNEGSASASEIFAGSIQKTGGGVVVGTTTYGKGTVQTPYDMTYAGAIKLTIAEYLLNGDYHVDGNGIKPDYNVAMGTLDTAEQLKDLVPMNEKITRKIGEVSLNVYGAQQRLNMLGNRLDVDGKFGTNTELAIKAFQKSNGLTASGQLDLKTVSKLDSKVLEQFDPTKDLQLLKAIEVLSKL